MIVIIEDDISSLLNQFNGDCKAIGLCRPFFDAADDMKGRLMGRKQIYTKDSVAKVLKETGYLSQKEIDKHPSLPLCGTIRKLFNTTKMTNVWNELGIPFIPKPSYTKDSVAKVLKETGYLSQKEIDKHPGLPSHTTILRLFKTTSMDNVWKELDIDIFGI